MAVDLLALSAGMRAGDTEELASIVKLARTADGYFMEAHVKLRPVDMATEGIFVCGTAHSPKLLDETIAQALAAASRATTFLSQKQSDPFGRHGPGGSRPLRRLPDLRAVLPLLRAEDQCRRGQ